MTEKIEMGNVHIPAKHQSAPKEHPADRAIRDAAQDIHDGRWVNESSGEPTDDLTIALGGGTAAEAQRIANNPTVQDFQDTADSLALGNHPRVIEALRKMQTEVDESRTSQEFAERSAMLFELNLATKTGQKWEGQERWVGAANEEMRIGLILTPAQFFARLVKVIGENRVYLHNKGTTEGRPGREAMTGRVPLLVPDPEQTQASSIVAPTTQIATLTMQLEGARNRYRESKDLQKRMEEIKTIQAIESKLQNASMAQSHGFPGFAMVATLQWPASTEWMIMRFDEFGVPTTAKYLGWRTALIAMIRADVITEKEAEKAFPISSSPAATWYKQQLFEWRNFRPGVIH